MALGIVQRVIAQSPNTAVSLTTSGVTTTSGNLLVVCLSCTGNHIGATPVTDSNTNTWSTALASAGVTRGWSAMFYAPNCIGGASHTFTFTPSASDFLAMAVFEISGADLTSPLSNTNSSTASASSHTSGNITSGAVMAEIFIGTMAMSMTTEVPSRVTGLLWPWVYNNAGTINQGIVAGYRIVIPSTTDAFTATCNATSNETIMIAGFKDANPYGYLLVH